jgi:2-polyprenyl-6-methoxyphenol hydroxylase-like FAD-dependent oxidoreductase
MTTHETDVVIVGAGPTGLMLAGDLARAGVRTIVLERRGVEGKQNTTSRAFAVHARTLEELDARGVADDLIATGAPVRELRLFRRTRIDLSKLPTRFPYLLVTPQFNTERILSERAQKLGAVVITGAPVEQVVQHAAGVTATTADATYRGKYLVGADGVHSVVREAIGLPFPGEAVVRSIMLADVQLSEPPDDVLTVGAEDAGFVFMAPYGDGFYRVFAWDRRHELPDDAPVSLDQVRELTAAVFGTDFGMHNPRWMSRFHSDERQAPHYRVGRVFLAGDAAHCHSPAGGMGMNTGIQDAANLGWKLAAAVQGWGPADVLDTYESERHPVGKMVLRLSGALVRFGIMRGRFLRHARNVVGSLMLGIPAVQHKGAGNVSGIGISYGNGADRVPDVALADGGRLYEALREGLFVLVAPIGVTVGETGAHIRVQHAAVDKLTLVRPDGYAAWSGPTGDRDGLAAAVATWS